MEFRILGPLEVVDGQRSIDVGAGKERALLAELVLHANRVVSRDRLMEVAWGGRPPATAAATLNTYISHLRATLEPTRAKRARAGLLLTRQPGYVMVIDDDRVDALRFEHLVAAGRKALASGDPQGAAETLREGLQLWRGAALADFAYEPWAQPEATRLEELRLAALEDRIEADLNAGRSQELVAELRQLVVEHPLRERLWGQLMLALYRAGRQSEALRAFTQLRRVLSEELGIDPSPRLRQLEDDILHQRRSLDPAPPGSAVPPPDARTRSAGPLTPDGFGDPLKAPGELPLRGRHEEWDMLARCSKLASAGQLQAVLIGGEPGIGKSRLARSFAGAARDEGATVLYGRCEEELGTPCQPFIEALRQYLLTCPEQDLVEYANLHGRELSRLVPELARRFPDLPAPHDTDPDAERYRMFQAVVSIFASASRARPVILLLDDLHWATIPTLLLLKHLVVSTQRMALLVIGTYRDSELTPVHPLSPVLADLWRESGVDRVQLRGLSGADVVDLVEDAAGGTLDGRVATLAEALERETSGNPFFLIEVVRNLVESGDARATADAALPTSVREVIGRRVGRLSENAQRVLGVGAVAGLEFRLYPLAGALETAEEEVLDAVEEACASALVSEIPDRLGWFRFAHALVRNTLYDGLSATRRARLHRRLAETIEVISPPEPGPHLTELAHHWLEAGDPESVARGASYACRAGDWALRNLAYEEAAAHYERALSRLAPKNQGHDLLRCDLLLALGDVQRRTGDPRYRATMETAAAVARALKDPERMGLAALGTALSSSWFVSAGPVAEPSVALYEEALDALRGRNTVLRARLLAQLAVELYYSAPRERARALCEEAVAIVRAAGDRTDVASVLAPCIVAVWDPGSLAERLGWGDELVAIGSELNSDEIAVQGRFLRGPCRFEAGDAQGAKEDFATGAALAGELHQPFHAWRARCVEMMEAILAGPPQRAEELAIATFQFGQEAGEPDAALIFTIQYALILWDQGRVEEVNSMLEASLQGVPAIPSFQAGLALSYWYLGREREARELFESLADSILDLRFDWGWYSAMMLLGETCASLADPTRASVLYRLLAPFGDRLALVGNGQACLGSVWRVLALLAATEGDHARALDHFERALRVHRRIGARAFLVRTQRAYAEMLLERTDSGDVARAAQLLHEGLRTAKDLGMAWEIRRLQELQGAVRPD